MTEPNLATDDNLLDVFQRQFRNMLEVADASYKNALACGVPIGVAARQRNRAMRKAFTWRDEHGLPVSTIPTTLLDKEAYGAVAMTPHSKTADTVGR
jgi:hypothetical protein